MLASLYIENIAVVRRAEIELGGGLTVLTGETGAGKSVIIDSIRLLMGARAQKEQIRRGENSATVAGLFRDLSQDAVRALAEIGIEPDENGELYIQRTVFSDGRGKTLVGGRQITLQLQREIGASLIAIHGQHDNQKLLRPELHIAFLDSYASELALLEEYRTAYRALKETRRELDETNRDEAETARLTEMYQYQINDIDSAKLRLGEDEELERLRVKIKSYEKLARYIHTVYASLCAGDKAPSARDRMGEAVGALERLSEFIPEADSMAERLRSCMLEAEDIGETVFGMLEDGDGDSSARLDRIESRLETISRLKRKYGADVREILDFRDKTKEKLDMLEESGDRAAALRKRLKTETEEAEKIARRLHSARIAAAEKLSAAVTAELAFLEMEKAVFSAEVKETGLGADGIDSVEFVIATNPGEPLLPLHKIASGGELSRVMLALKCVLEDKEGTGTLIFDEVDTGVSGKTAQKIGIKLHQISESAQVICITHAAQIAALSDHHLLILKRENNGRAETGAKELDEEGRTEELARIMGGEHITEKLLESARELRIISKNDSERNEK